MLFFFLFCVVRSAFLGVDQNMRMLLVIDGVLVDGDDLDEMVVRSNDKLLGLFNKTLKIALLKLENRMKEIGEKAENVGKECQFRGYIFTMDDSESSRGDDEGSTAQSSPSAEDLLSDIPGPSHPTDLISEEKSFSGNGSEEELAAAAPLPKRMLSLWSAASERSFPPENMLLELEMSPNTSTSTILALGLPSDGLLKCLQKMVILSGQMREMRNMTSQISYIVAQNNEILTTREFDKVKLTLLKDLQNGQFDAERMTADLEGLIQITSNGSSSKEASRAKLNEVTKRNFDLTREKQIRRRENADLRTTLVQSCVENVHRDPELPQDQKKVVLEQIELLMTLLFSMTEEN